MNQTAMPTSVALESRAVLTLPLVTAFRRDIGIQRPYVGAKRSFMRSQKTINDILSGDSGKTSCRGHRRNQSRERRENRNANEEKTSDEIANCPTKAPTFNSDEEWVQDHRKQFGKDPSFFDV